MSKYARHEKKRRRAIQLTLFPNWVVVFSVWSPPSTPVVKDMWRWWHQRVIARLIWPD